MKSLFDQVAAGLLSPISLNATGQEISGLNRDSVYNADPTSSVSCLQEAFALRHSSWIVLPRCTTGSDECE